MGNDTRREFIKKTGVVAGAALLATTPARVLGANDRVRLGVIGTGAEALLAIHGNLDQVIEGGNQVVVGHGGLLSGKAPCATWTTWDSGHAGSPWNRAGQ